ncbi:hypothetical protein GALMADRAFT_145487 [Galerina marginata CBS 339.88]|uniref:Flavin reductase like domain-containing protein n=1 Tax=Galerina marginata (strain CBS 339.88) TaxID=685588 RepID=A0A067SHJ4_GALM3|nr:hypothetical protein GALMADRAFT_145487 [Galerina marginata CBS 339.88]
MTSNPTLPQYVPTQGFKYTAAPNPGWTYGQSIDATPEGRAWADGEKEGWTVVDGSTEDPRTMFNYMVSGIVPRPVAFVSSISVDGVENLAPYSVTAHENLLFTAAGSTKRVTPNPPVVSFSCASSSGAAKDTLRNVLAGTGFTINIISEPWIHQADAASIDAPFEVDEWPITGLTKAPSIHVKAARVKESAFSMECELYQTLGIKHPKTGITTATLVVALVKYIHIRNDVVDASLGVIDPGKLRPVAAAAKIPGMGLTYARMSEGYVLPQRSWKKVGGEIGERVGGMIGGERKVGVNDCVGVSKHDNSTRAY